MSASNRREWDKLINKFGRTKLIGFETYRAAATESLLQIFNVRKWKIVLQIERNTAK